MKSRMLEILFSFTYAGILDQIEKTLEIQLKFILSSIHDAQAENQTS